MATWAPVALEAPADNGCVSTRFTVPQSNGLQGYQEAGFKGMTMLERTVLVELHPQQILAPWLTCRATVKWPVLVSRTMLVFMADWIPHRHCR
jgi:hypothetical protein